MSQKSFFVDEQLSVDDVKSTPESELVLYLLILFILVEHFLDSYLSLRQLRVYQTAVVIPPEIEKATNPIHYHIARIWGMDREYYVLFKTLIFTIFLGIIELVFGLIPACWMLSVYIAKSWHWDYQNEMLVGYMFAFLLIIYSTLRKLPLSLIQTYVIQKRYTLQIPPPPYFFAMQLVQLVINLILVAPIVCFIVFVVEYGGDLFYIYLWVASFILTVLILIIYPLMIAPCLDTYVHIPEGSLKTEIDALAVKVGFPPKRIYVVQSSKQGDRSNAYFYGVCCVKRIIIHEGLLPMDARPPPKTPQQAQARNEQAQAGAIQFTNKEVLAIICHELGHWKYGHVLIGIILMQIGMFLLYVILGFAFQWNLLYEAVGFEPGLTPIIAGFIIVIAYVISPFRAICTLISRIIMRRFELQADNFSVKHGYSDALGAGLMKIYQLNFSFPVYDKCYTFYYHTHPTLLQRLSKL